MSAFAAITNIDGKYTRIGDDFKVFILLYEYDNLIRWSEIEMYNVTGCDGKISWVVDDEQPTVLYHVFTPYIITEVCEFKREPNSSWTSKMFTVSILDVNLKYVQHLNVRLPFIDSKDNDALHSHAYNIYFIILIFFFVIL